MTKPFLKWAGGKAKLAEQIQSFFPEKIRTYYEPFLGGGAVFLSLDPNRYENAVLSDLNNDLITTYLAVKTHPDSLGEVLDGFAENYSKEFYLYLRSYNPLNTGLSVATRFIFLNKTCFNGLYRENSKGQFNVPFGNREKCPKLYDPKTLSIASALLEKARLRSAAFQTTIQDARAGDVVYCDPPYVASSSTSNFTRYTCVGFDLADQQALIYSCEDAAARGATVVLSNSEAALETLVWSSKWEFFTVQAKRSISAKSVSRKNVNEILAVLRGND